MGISKFILRIFRKADQKTGMTYDEMLERACIKLAATEIKTKQDYIKKRSAELVETINDNEVCIDVAIINFKIELAENELDECQRKIDDSDNRIGKEYHLSKEQRRWVEIKIINLKYNLKNLFKYKKRFVFLFVILTRSSV